ncbi:metal-dependent hydrolase [Orrella sp. 11846]|uniref:metal-dependent hydrolase n=1 Tax=Orrella sp. 11846 TaxID=3409913 RepID=UPI003B593605
MDSLTQIVLGASVTVAVMQRRTAVWKAAVWGGIAGTLPDLDVFLSHGDPILNMVLHRAESHALFWLTLFSIPFAWLVARIHREQAQQGWWWLALWLALVTHPLLDLFTVYGTQLGLPFTDYPFALNSVFIIDPAVTLPWLIGLIIVLMRRGDPKGQTANLVGLSVGVAVLFIGLGLQTYVERHALKSLAQQGVKPDRILVTPAPLSMLLWRVVAMDEKHYYEGFYGLRDQSEPMAFEEFNRGAEYESAIAQIDGAQRIRRFSHGFYKLHETQQGRLVITDLRMGLEPNYNFSFAVAERGSPFQALPTPQAVGRQGDISAMFTWLKQRIRGELIPPPR